jgi:hypothetical protein
VQLCMKIINICVLQFILQRFAHQLRLCSLHLSTWGAKEARNIGPSTGKESVENRQKHLVCN